MLDLQDVFFAYLKARFDKYRLNLERRETKRWYRCYIGERTACWMQKPNQDGSFWVFVGITIEDILKKMTELKVTIIDHRKCQISFKGVEMSPIEIIDRGKMAKGNWEKNYPVGFKVKDKTQFDLACEIILATFGLA